MSTYALRFVLRSDATFGCGDGVAGLVDVEVQHDEYGCPYLGGRALKGLLVGECAEILAALRRKGKDRDWEDAARQLFGEQGDSSGNAAFLHVGNAQLPEDLRRAVARDIEQGKLDRAAVLDSLTAVRRQTAIDPKTGAPKEHSLRSLRVILRQTPFEAELSFRAEPDKKILALLAACVRAFRRAGTGCNRGLGRLTAELLRDGEPATADYFNIFRQEVTGCTL